MDISNNIGNGVFSWTDVVTGVTGTRTDYSHGSAVQVSYSTTEVAWKNGTLTLAQSSANTGTTVGAIIYVDTNRAKPVLVAKINNTLTDLASGA